MIGILDIEMGNLRSLSKAIYSLGYDFVLVRAAQDLDSATHLMVPGVGNYRTAMSHVDAQGMREPIRAFAGTGRPVAGICLGMQILSATGEEGGDTQGLGLVPGRVVRMTPEGGLPLPHVGWNTTRLRRKDHPVFHKVKDGRDFYYVHSYHLRCYNPDHVLAETDYGADVAAIVGTGNVIGFQFHPEKSQANGLRLLDNFCAWDGKA